MAAPWSFGTVLALGCQMTAQRCETGLASSQKAISPSSSALLSLRKPVRTSSMHPRAKLNETTVIKIKSETSDEE
eukprot:2875838-Amphidinium_carterae.1